MVHKHSSGSGKVSIRTFEFNLQSERAMDVKRVNFNYQPLFFCPFMARVVIPAAIDRINTALRCALRTANN